MKTIISTIDDNDEYGISFDKNGKHQPIFDRKISRALKGRNNENKLFQLLTAVYNIRCNTFHGRKGFEETQKEIIKAVNNVLEALVPVVKDHFKSRLKEKNERMLQQYINER